MDFPFRDMDFEAEMREIAMDQVRQIVGRRRPHGRGRGWTEPSVCERIWSQLLGAEVPSPPVLVFLLSSLSVLHLVAAAQRQKVEDTGHANHLDALSSFCGFFVVAAALTLVTLVVSSPYF